MNLENNYDVWKKTTNTNFDANITGSLVYWN